jgi:hypothetical protein
MEATARLSRRAQYPAYRFRVSFDPADRVDLQLMESIATAVLTHMAAGELEAVIGAGENGARQSLYFVVNRVHPERGTAWVTDWDMERITAALRVLEVEHGLRAVPSPAKADRAAPRLGWSRLLETGFDRGPYGDSLPAGSWRARIERSAWGKQAAGIHLFVRDLADGNRFWIFVPFARPELYELFRTLPDGSDIEVSVSDGSAKRKRRLLGARRVG